MKDFFVEDILEKFEDYTQPVDQGPSFMNQEPRNMYVAGGVIKAAKKFLTQTPKPKPSILKREAVPLNLTQINEISKNKEFEQAWKNYKISIRKVGRRKYSKEQFFEMWARENMAQGGRIGFAENPLKNFDRKTRKLDKGVTKISSERVSSKIMKHIYKDKATGKEIEVFKVKITDQPSNKGGNMKAGKGGNYKTLLSKEFSTLEEAIGSRDDYYKDNPGKRVVDPTKKSDAKKKRRENEKLAGGDERFKQGNKEIQKGHSTNIEGKNKIKPKNIIYTPTEINSKMGGKAGAVDTQNPSSLDSLDLKQRNSEAKIEEIKKSKLPESEKKRLLDIEDKKLTKYVAQSDGFKTSVLSDGSEFGTSFRSLQSQDMFDEFPDMTEKQVKEFVGEYFTQKGDLKPKYANAKNLPQSVKDNIVKAYTFNENVKNAQANAKKSKFINRMMDFCPNKLAGGGSPGACSLKEAKAGMKKQIDLAKKASKDGKIPKKFGKLRSFMTSVLGVFDAPIELLLVLPEITAGNTDAAIQNSTLGWFTDKGEFNLEKLKDSNFEAYQFLKDKQARKEYTEAEETLDSLQPFLDKAQKEGTLNQVNPEILEQYRNANNKRESIIDEYQEYGYSSDDPTQSPLTGKVATQNYLKDKVKTDWQKRQDKLKKQSDADYEASGLVFDKDPNQKQLQYEDVYKAPTDLKSFIEQKGELGKDTMLQYGVRDEANRTGVGDIFDNYIQGADNKDERDLYSELPIEYANQLAALEKEELNQGLKSKGNFMTRAFRNLLESQQMDTDQLYAKGGLANLMKKYYD